MMKKFTTIQITIAVVVVLALLAWWLSSSKKPGQGITIVTPMPMSNYSIDDTDVFDDDGVPDVQPAPFQQGTVTKPAVKVKEHYADIEDEGYAVYDAQVDKDWMIRPEEGYDSYSPTEFKADLLE